MKKILVTIIGLSLWIGVLAGCAAADGNAAGTEDGSVTSAGSFSVVTTIFPEYDWVRQILGDNPANAELTMLLDSGVDLHSYQPTASDMLKISTCDLFVYVGGESDSWVDDALSEATNPDMIVVNLLDSLGDRVKEEEVVEGMEAEAEEESDGEEEEAEYDEHVWLSLKNASYLCEVIGNALAKVDETHADVYKENLASYEEKLHKLDEAYETTVSDAGYQTILFGDRFPFRYLTDDYGLDYYAAFVGCSAETEASFETITFLAQKVDELSLPAILTIEGSDKKIAETIAQNTIKQDQKILTMDSMQSTTSADVGDGATYLKIMEENQKILTEALNE